MTGEAWLLVAAAAVAGYLLAKGMCGCDHARTVAASTPFQVPMGGFTGGCSGPRGTCPVEIDTTSPVFDTVVRGIG